MPTLPPEPTRAGPGGPAGDRRTAESFGIDPRGYDQARPAYPDELVARIVAGSPGPEVLDVGCGTGIAARQFQAAGCTVLGIDPDARMAAYARSRGLRVEEATFEAWDPAGRSFDTVVAGQSWHWVDPATGAVKAAQVLRPDGRLAVFGHVYEPPIEVAEPFAAAFRRVVPDSPFPAGPARRPLDLYRALYGRIADDLAATGRFDAPEQWQFDWERAYTRDDWLRLLPTTGGLTPLPPRKTAAILDAVGEAIDALGGHFTMQYTTLAVTAARAGRS
jgi:SAM-dependent methyltransferase